MKKEQMNKLRTKILNELNYSILNMHKKVEMPVV